MTTSPVPDAVIKRISDEMIERAMNATAEIALAYSALIATGIVARNGAVAQAANILGEYISPLLVAAGTEHKPIEVTEDVRATLAPFAMITNSVIPRRVPPPRISPRTYADGYRAGRRSLEPFLDYNKFHGRIDDQPASKGA